MARCSQAPTSSKPSATPSARGERVVILRRIAGLAAGALFTGLVGSLLLVLATGTRAGVGFEAVGVGAAVLALAAIAGLASRRSV